MSVPTHQTRRRLAHLEVLASALLFLGLLSTVLVWVGCARPGKPQRVVLVSIDTLNLLYTDLFGEPTGLTPRLAEMASRSTLFEEAHTAVAITLPSHTSLLSGRLPWESGVMLNGDRVPSDLPTLQRVFQHHGYRTGSFISAAVLDHRYGLQKGFDHYDDGFTDELGRSYRTADEVTDRALAWVQDHREDPFFLWVHYFDLHTPRVGKDAPPDARLLLDGEEVARWSLAKESRESARLELPPGRHRLTLESLRKPHRSDSAETSLSFNLKTSRDFRPYLAPGQKLPQGFIRLDRPWTLDLVQPGTGTVELTMEVKGRLLDMQPPLVDEEYRKALSFIDQNLGRLEEGLAALGLDEDTLWVVVSDHGEGIWRRWGSGHAQYAWEVQLRTLWLLRGPGIPAGRRIADTPVLLTDVAPTVLDLVGLSVPELVPGSGSGRSQAGCWKGGECTERTDWWAYGVRQKDEEVVATAGYSWPWKTTWHVRQGEQLFHLAPTPWEGELAGRQLEAASGADAEPGVTLLRRLPRQQQIFQRWVDERGQAALGETDREILKSLGYL